LTGYSKIPFTILWHEGHQSLFQLGKAGASNKMPGFFGGAVINSFQDLAIEDEGRLRNFNIREHFFDKTLCFSQV